MTNKRFNNKFNKKFPLNNFKFNNLLHKMQINKPISINNKDNNNNRSHTNHNFNSLINSNNHFNNKINRFLNNHYTKLFNQNKHYLNKNKIILILNLFNSSNNKSNNKCKLCFKSSQNWSLKDKKICNCKKNSRNMNNKLH